MYGRGIFCSINGYSPDSVQALKNGKALKTILVDGADLVLITEVSILLRKCWIVKLKRHRQKEKYMLMGIIPSVRLSEM